MAYRFHILALGLTTLALMAPSAGGREPDPLLAHPPAAPTSPLPTQTAEAEPVDQWLDEVRAQRQAWEERRRDQKEAIDARRRSIDPWGAAQQEAREQETSRRREAFRDKIERDREAFFNQGPWSSGSQWSDGRAGPGPELPPAANPAETPPGLEDGSGAPYPPLPGWDNRWYYRGF